MLVRTYDVQNIVEDISEYAEKPMEDVTLEEVIEYLDEWVEDDFHGAKGLIYQDENGEEL